MANEFHEMWDRLQVELQRKPSWGKNQILDLMNQIEKEEMRKAFDNWKKEEDSNVKR